MRDANRKAMFAKKNAGHYREFNSLQKSHNAVVDSAKSATKYATLSKITDWLIKQKGDYISKVDLMKAITDIGRKKA